MFEKIQATIKDPTFQRNVAQAAGSVVSLVATIAVSQLIIAAMTGGVNALMDKIQSTETPAE